MRCFRIYNITKTILMLDEDEFTTSKVADSTGRIQDMFIVNESGFYSIIMMSRIPQAKVFKKWVANEFLPSIRKHGAYMTENTRKY
ncbi:Bro-N domain-containing protein [Bacillus sp. GX]|uniref:BRO-N domain-containing protein n=1 Tax=Bacillus sp. GX TaxID=3382157 RepID=UPI0038CBF58D